MRGAGVRRRHDAPRIIIGPPPSRPARVAQRFALHAPHGPQWHSRTCSTNTPFRPVNSLSRVLPYQRLPSDGTIRLLVLHPGSPGEPLRITLRQAPLQHRGFEALSYVWRDPYFNARLGTEVAEVHLLGNDEAESSRVQISANLYLALRRLRKLTQPRILWVDARLYRACTILCLQLPVLTL